MAGAFAHKGLTTRATRALGVDLPIVSAPMAGAAGADLALAVSGAGGFGLLGGGYGDRDWIAAECEKLAASDLPFGIGLITWKLAEDPGLLDIVLASNPRAVFLSFGDPAPFAAPIRAAGAKLICQVQDMGTLREALAAGADMIVAQGGEAGGHGGGRGLMSFVPEVVDYMTENAPDVPLLAAGGIADGRGLAAALMLGADGVLVGSRLWASAEAAVPEGFHADAIAATGDDTQRGHLPDVARGLDWPAPFTIRTHRSAWIARWDGAGVGPVSAEARAEYAAGAAAGDGSRAAAIVGEAAGLIGAIAPAKEIIKAMASEAENLLERGGRRD